MRHSPSILLTLFLLLCGSLHANQGSMFDPAMILPLNCMETTKQYRLVKGNAPAFLYFPGEKVDLTFSFSNVGAKAEQIYAIEIQGVHTRRPNKARIYVDPFGHPDILNLDGKAIRHPLEIESGDEKEVAFEVRNLPVPQRYGTYCLILLRGEGKKKENRILLGSVVRLVRTRDDAIVENTPVFGEGQIFSGFKDKAEAAGAYYRMGVRGVRCEISWRGNKPDGSYDWKQYDELTGALKEGGIQAMFTLGGVTSKMYGIATSHQPIPAAVKPDWNGSPYGGRADWGCAPKHFSLYAEWVRKFSERYWENGKGALWGFENYNEPWEGGGISGYARDCISYRDWQRYMARAAYSVSKNIRICAASSIMNTEDKFYSEGPDENGKYEFDQHIDVFTDHYVTPNMAYGPAVAKAHGKFSIENETWLVISEYLLPQVMCQWMASGQSAVSPWHPRVLFQGVAGGHQRYHCPSTVPVATAAFNHFVTGLRFKRLAFHNHLPWLFQFGEDDNPRGVCVMLGQLLTRGGPTPQDNPHGRLWGQVDSVDGGIITVDNTDGSLRFYDVAANEVFQGQKSVRIDLTMLPTYIQSSRGPAHTVERVRQGNIRDKYPAEILPHDFTQHITDKALALNVDLANRLNRPITGKLTVRAPDGFGVANNGESVSVNAGEKKTIAISFSAVKEDPSNQYPFEFTWATDAGVCSYKETLNCVVAVKGTKTIDGDLGDWEGIPSITLVGKDKKISQDELARKPWLRLLKDLPEGAMFAELKMAWDENNLYVAARVNDPTPQTDKPRMEGRDEDAYFHSAASDREAPWKAWLEKHAQGQSFSQVPYVYKKKPFDNSYTGDQLQIAFNVAEGWHDLVQPTEVPWGFHAVPDTDYEYCAYLCADGKSEVWNLLAPGLPRIHDWPHQPKGKKTTNPTPGARHVVKQNGNVRTYEIALSKANISGLELAAGTSFGFVFRVGNKGGPRIDYGDGKAVTKSNGLTLHPYWQASPSCSVTWRLIDSP
ncbi:MAG: hypothetical protein QGF00_26115 [Planctomycetota bacterium]|nr:hypothetical protein [Planctomycetota bacterium]